MSEMKCPCCGDTVEPAIYNDYYECKNCWFRCEKADLPRITAAMECQARHNALREAVAWERECDAFAWQLVREGVLPRSAAIEVQASLRLAQSEVDRLLGASA